MGGGGGGGVLIRERPSTRTAVYMMQSATFEWCVQGSIAAHVRPGSTAVLGNEQPEPPERPPGHASALVA